MIYSHLASMCTCNGAGDRRVFDLGVFLVELLNQLDLLVDIAMWILSEISFA